MVKRKLKQIEKNSENQTQEKMTIQNYEKVQLIRISNHIKLLGNTEYIVYQSSRGLQKDL